jgi:TPP-dependent 2-oxoacid decarboxylase
MKKSVTVSEFLLARLHELGLRHIFGVPGDYVLDFLDRIVESPIKHIATCNELNAGYAADGYARVNGIGAAVVTYGVGGFSIANAVAGAYAEQVPLIVISGAPHSSHRSSHALVHHISKNYYLQYEIFRKFTVDSVMLMDPAKAATEIDRVLKNCIFHSRPVYIEIPVDMVDAICEPSEISHLKMERSSAPATLEECAAKCAEYIDAAKNPVIIAGVEVGRFKLANSLLELVERIEIPYVTMVGSKSVLPELHPQFAGVYQGALSRKEVKENVENSDCIIALGVWLNDFNTGGFSAKLDEDRMININSEFTKIGKQDYHNIWMGDLIGKLSGRLKARSYMSSHPISIHFPTCGYEPEVGKKMTAKRFFERVNSMLNDNMVLLAEAGDSICAAPSFYVQEPENFIVQAYYLSIGYCLPASLGVSIANPAKRPVVLTGDGAFQMTAQEVSTIIRYGCNPIIFLINNGGYVIERVIHDGPYNDIQDWKYHMLPEVFGKGNSVSFDVRTEDELENAILVAISETSKAVFIEVHTDPYDCSEMLAQIAHKIRALSKK